MDVRISGATTVNRGIHLACNLAFVTRREPFLTRLMQSYTRQLYHHGFRSVLVELTACPPKYRRYVLTRELRYRPYLPVGKLISSTNTMYLDRGDEFCVNDRTNLRRVRLCRVAKAR